MNLEWETAKAMREQREEASKRLQMASREDQLRAAVLHWRAHVAPEQVDRDFAAHHERRRLHVSSTLDGLVALDGLLDAEAGNTVLTAISALAGTSSSPAVTAPSTRSRLAWAICFSCCRKW